MFHGLGISWDFLLPSWHCQRVTVCRFSRCLFWIPCWTFVEQRTGGFGALFDLTDASLWVGFLCFCPKVWNIALLFGPFGTHLNPFWSLWNVISPTSYHLVGSRRLFRGSEFVLRQLGTFIQTQASVFCPIFGIPSFAARRMSTRVARKEPKVTRNEVVKTERSITIVTESPHK